MKSMSLQNPSEAFSLLSGRMGRLLRLKFKKELKKLNLNLHDRHFGVLLDLWSNDGLKQHDLALASIKDKATITRSLDELEKMKIIFRVNDEEDRRNKIIYLTYTGKKLREILLPLIHTITHLALEGISSEEYKVFLKVLRKMYFNLRNPC
jgi:MarR family transcriptional regulator, organic hydroperoxide resistance regulator